MYYGLGGKAAASKEEIYMRCFAHHRIASRSLDTALAGATSYLSNNLPVIYNESWGELAANLKRYHSNEAARVRNPFTLLVSIGAELSLQDSPEKMQERAATVLAHSQLKQREHIVVAGIYGIGIERSKSLQEVADALKLFSPEVAGRILRRGLSKLEVQQTKTGDNSEEPSSAGTDEGSAFVAIRALAKELKTDARTITELIEELGIPIFHARVGTPGKTPVVINKEDKPLLWHELNKRYPLINPAHDNTVKDIAARLGRPERTIVKWIAEAGFSGEGYMKYSERRIATKCFDNATTARMVEMFSNK